MYLSSAGTGLQPDTVLTAKIEVDVNFREFWYPLRFNRLYIIKKRYKGGV